MALADPQVITVNAVAKSMPRIDSQGTHSVYQLEDQTFTLDIRHTANRKDKKLRHKALVTFTQRAIVPDPLTSVNDYETVSISLMIDRPEAGFSSTQIDQMVAGFKTWLTTTMVGNLYGRQS